MATDSHVKSVTNTLTSTTADEITLTQLWPVVRITNHSTSTWLYARQDGTAVAEADGTTAIAPNTTRAVKGERAEGTNTIVVSVVGNGNTYTVEGINGGDINIAELEADVAALQNAISPVFLGSGGFVLSAGSPAHNSVNGWAAAWLMDATADEALAADLLVLPSNWATFHIDILWANNGAGTGDVSWVIYFSQIGDAEVIPTGVELGAVVTDTAGAASELVVTRYATGHVKSTDAFQTLTIYRQGSNVADTLANDVGFIGLLFTPVTFG